VVPTIDDAHEIKPLTVAELDRKLKRAVEGAANDVWVEGEVSSLKLPGSGHVYFTLKDEREDACIDCVMYRAAAMRSKRVLAEGQRVQDRGKATLWAPRGKLQLVVDAARQAGRGALLEALEQLKLKLAAEGLFDTGRKRAIPRDPRIIGVVTSSSGAAIHDIAQVAFRRGGAHILLAPATVQGAQAPAQIIAALDRLVRVTGVDVIIVGRGGGASDDLAAFQEEAVVRWVAASPVPIISAVGHEIDTTLTDLAADVRAATPSQAAEMVVPESRERERALRDASVRLARAMRARLLEDRVAIERLAVRVGDPRALLGEKQQMLDELTDALRESIERGLSRRRDAALRLAARFSARHPRVVLEVTKGEIVALDARLRGSMRARIEAARSRSVLLAGSLSELSPLAVLGRGYAVALLPDGKALTRAADAAVGQALRIRLHEGELSARIETRTVDVDQEPLPNVRFALLGHPVGHSASPAMHSAAFAAFGVPYTYEAIDCPDSDCFAIAVDRLREGELAGVNVTAPYKIEALSLADKIGASAASVGAANTLVRIQGQVVAHNTDVPALTDELRGLGPRPGAALVLGAGGAAAAAVSSCKRLDASEVWVTSRSFVDEAAIEASASAARMRALGGRPLVWPGSPAGAARLASLAPSLSMLVQATSAGVLSLSDEGVWQEEAAAGEAGEALAALVPWALLPDSAVALDVVYGPRATAFERSGAERGLRAAGGLGMLARQGAWALRLWLGQTPPHHVLLAAAKRWLGHA
jgi:exodeoxyribonuclease VII large subunit